jgi:hypothetical protein
MAHLPVAASMGEGTNPPAGETYGNALRRGKGHHGGLTVFDITIRKS